MATNEIDYYYDRKMATFYDYSTFMRQFSDIAEGSANQSAQSINARIDSQTSHIDSAKYAIVASNEEVKDTLLELKSSVGTGLANVANKFDSTNQTVGTGFNRVSNQLGQIGVLMHIGLARTESAINQLSGDVRERLDALIDIETHPLRTQVSELYDRALRHFRNG
ncbi:MAG: hypothetical protein LBM06_08430, partial [Prevotellaceae bacterium]|nr:hypothetical protein [Prevotellaceae bacterium]